MNNNEIIVIDDSLNTAAFNPPPMEDEEEGEGEEEEQQLLSDLPEPSLDSEFTKKLRSSQMAKLAKINADNDLDSLDNNSTAHQKPNAVDIPNDNDEEIGSIASSLTNNSIQSHSSEESLMCKTSTISNGSNFTTTSNRDSQHSSSTRRSKYELTETMVSTIANAGMKEGLLLSEIESKVLAYQQLKINEARSMALVSVASFAAKNMPEAISSKDEEKVTSNNPNQTKNNSLVIKSTHEESQKQEKTLNQPIVEEQKEKVDHGVENSTEQQALNKPQPKESPTKNKEEEDHELQEKSNISNPNKVDKAKGNLIKSPPKPKDIIKKMIDTNVKRSYKK